MVRDGAGSGPGQRPGRARGAVHTGPPGSPTSAAARAGRASRWPGPIRRRRSPGSTSTRPRSRRPGRTPGGRGCRTGSASPAPAAPRWTSRTPSTPRSSSRRCTTCPAGGGAGGRARARCAGRAVVVMDEAVADEFIAPGDVVERTMYGYSTLICLPDGLSTSPSAATGTVMRRRGSRVRLRGRVRRDGRAADRGLRVLPVLPAAVTVRRSDQN